MVRLLIVLSSLVAASCSSADKKNTENKTEISVEKTEKKIQIPIINLTDSVSADVVVLTVGDTSKTLEGIGVKAGKLLEGAIGKCIKLNGLKTDSIPYVWKRNTKPPYSFEAGVKVNYKPTTGVAGVYVKELKGDSAIIAHYFGPQEQINTAYDALNSRIKDMGRNPIGSAYELHIGSLSNQTDPYKVRTDIILQRSLAPVVKEKKTNDKELFARKGQKFGNKDIEKIKPNKTKKK